ncbi:hypothetical protein PPEP_a0993 [Pseudoalteromonas peptidolytica F12-50-A1]|uniref:Uncharacterized protein n=1 Tax=Pseudoalteromonas peptidolytica F12-50-A1 TaxID=1315280 RepID=A0A8I0T4A8_9GAMM|nr:hypothetical protein [Pseudoalteromonas peptidolytica F12-50-A1]
MLKRAFGATYELRLKIRLNLAPNQGNLLFLFLFNYSRLSSPLAIFREV